MASVTYPSIRGTEPRSSFYPADLPISTLDPGRLVRIYAGKLFDPHALQLLPQRVVTVSEHLGLVVDVRPYAEGEASAVDFARDETAIDLRDATVLPGFVDAHVHCEFEFISRPVDGEEETFAGRSLRIAVRRV